MSDVRRRLLDRAAARAREAEAAYKRWARTDAAGMHGSLFAALGAAERDHWEMLAHIAPGDLPAPSGAESELGDGAALRPLPPEPTRDGLLAAAAREALCALLYDRLADLGGETQTLFRSFAEEERRHVARIEALVRETLAAGS